MDPDTTSDAHKEKKKKIWKKKKKKKKKKRKKKKNLAYVLYFTLDIEMTSLNMLVLWVMDGLLSCKFERKH